MKRVLSCGAVALFFLVSGADANAQGKFSGFAAVGPTTTSGDLKDADSTKSGFIVQGGFEYKLSAPLWLRVDASMGWNDRIGIRNEDAYIWTFAGRAEYWLPFGTDKLRPYVLGGAGIMLYKRNPGEPGLEDTDTFRTKNRTLMSGGAGVDWQLGGTSLFVEGRYDMGADNRAMIPIVIGARWGARQ
jgi:opacity protein-like surface antigen